MERITNYCNGQFVEAASGKYVESCDPATGKPYALLPDSGERDVAAAVTAAATAFTSWAHFETNARASLLHAIADRIEKESKSLALAECVDTGKPLHLAERIDIPRAAANFHFFAEAITSFSSESYSMGNEALNYTLRQPLGVVGCISPWNLPLYLLTWKIAPALAAGNCVIAKPSEITPMTAYLLAKICDEVGLPAGVLNILHGYGHSVGAAVCAHPDISAISFTGGTETGKSIASTVAPHFKKLSLELGGKNPNVIFADCDYDKMLEGSLKASFMNQGQICLCGSRILVERPLYERFREDFVNRTSALQMGDPLEATTDQGAIVSYAHMEKILQCIEKAKKDGGTILSGGAAVQLEGRCADGYFIEPTIIEGLSPQCSANQEEIFGPVVTIAPFDSEEEALTLANGTVYGLATILWTENVSRAHRFAAKVDSGIVWVNCWMLRDLRTPFGGMKNSGVGREGGVEALHFFTETKNVCIKVAQ